MPNNICFNSKILLFGEYSIIQDAMGLAVPYPLFYGKLVFPKVSQASPKVQQSNEEIKAFCDYLKNQVEANKLDIQFDFISLDFDIAQGLFFESSIPQGFGVGSSGAMTAAIYDGYAKNKIHISTIPTSEQIVRLKKNFGVMESYFHGSSSGFDPLICYLNKPLLIKSKTDIEVVEIPTFGEGKGAIFILDTGKERRTEPLVNLFLEKLKSEVFSELCKTELHTFNDNCIKAFLQADTVTLFENVKDLSHFQFTNFKSMIPNLFLKPWMMGLKSEKYSLKLCGAGGGGFILGFTEDFEQAHKMLANYNIRIVYRI